MSALADALNTQRKDNVETLRGKDKLVLELTRQVDNFDVDKGMKLEMIDRLQSRLKVVYLDISSKDGQMTELNQQIDEAVGASKREKGKPLRELVQDLATVVEENRTAVKTNTGDAEFISDTCRVTFGPDVAEFRNVDGYTFGELLFEACEWWDVDSRCVKLLNDRAVAWSKSMLVGPALGLDPMDPTKTKQPLVELSIIKAEVATLVQAHDDKLRAERAASGEAQDFGAEPAAEVLQTMASVEASNDSTSGINQIPAAVNGGPQSTPPPQPVVAIEPPQQASTAVVVANTAIVSAEPPGQDVAVLDDLPPAPVPGQQHPPGGDEEEALLAPKQIEVAWGEELGPAHATIEHPMLADWKIEQEKPKKNTAIREVPPGLTFPEIMARKENNRQFLVYIIFIVFFAINVIYRRSVVESFHVNKVLQDRLVGKEFAAGLDFNGVQTEDDVWLWVNRSVTPFLFCNDDDCAEQNFRDQLQQKDRFIGGQYKLIGQARLATWRVKSGSCKIASALDKFNTSCYAHYGHDKIVCVPPTGEDRVCQIDGIQERSYFYKGAAPVCELPDFDSDVCNTCMHRPVVGEVESLDVLPPCNKCCAPGFYFVSQTATENFPPVGVISSYSSSAYVRDFNATGQVGEWEDWVSGIDTLRSNQWIDSGTRAVQVKMTLFHPNYRLFSTLDFLFEFDIGGGIRPQWRINTMKLDSYDQGVDSGSAASLTADIIVVLYLFFAYYSTLVKMYDSKIGVGFWPYFRDPWNLVGHLLLMTLLCAIVFRLLFLCDVKRDNFHAPPHRNFMLTQQWLELTDLSNKYETAFTLDSFVAFLAFVKVFDFFQHQKSISMIFDALKLASLTLVGFLFVFLLVMGSFTLMANFVYGPFLWQYASIGSSLGSLCRMLMGHFDYHEMYLVNASVTPIFFALFFFMQVMIMLNILIAILCEAYMRIRREYFEKLGEDGEPNVLMELIQSFKEYRERSRILTSMRNEIQRAITWKEEVAQRAEKEALKDEMEGKKLDKLKEKETKALKKIQLKLEQEAERAAELAAKELEVKMEAKSAKREEKYAQAVKDGKLKAKKKPGK